MIYRFSILILFTIFIALSCKTIPPNKNEVRVEKKNDTKAEKGIIDKDVADFLVAAADSRMMGIKQGKLAAQRGTTEAIRAYGNLMIQDQTMLLKVIKKLGKTHKITLPKVVSAEKEDGFKDLNSKQGEDFDSKFMKMMKIDHKRDIKDFKKAEKFKDNEISQFAAKYLPMMESHQEKLENLK